MSIRATRRFLGLAMLAVSAHAVGGPSTGAIGDQLGLFVETSVSQYQMLCSAREPATQAEWRTQVSGWRDRNGPSLRELRKIAAQVDAAARERAFDPANAETPENKAGLLSAQGGFMMLAASQPAFELARVNDVQAAALCRKWLGLIAPSGALDNQVALAIEGGKRLLAALSPPSR